MGVNDKVSDEVKEGKTAYVLGHQPLTINH